MVSSRTCTQASFHSEAVALGRCWCTWHAPAKHGLENAQWCAFLVDAVIFSFPCLNPPLRTLLQQQHWRSMDNLGFNNYSIDDWQDEAKYFHCSLKFLINLYSKAKHTTISHDRYAGVQCIPATSLVRLNIFGPWVTAIDRFHCSNNIHMTQHTHKHAMHTHTKIPLVVVNKCKLAKHVLSRHAWLACTCEVVYTCTTCF